jgi:transcriptional accessory protein Tex/SPT6
MLATKWKGGAGNEPGPKQEAVKAGQVHSFRIAKLDVERKRIDLELVS